MTPHNKHPWYQYIIAIAFTLAVGAGVAFAVTDGVPRVVKLAKQADGFSFHIPSFHFSDTFTAQFSSPVLSRFSKGVHKSTAAVSDAFSSIFVGEYEMTPGAAGDVSAEAALEEGPMTTVIQASDQGSASAKPGDVRRPPVITAPSYVVMDMTTGDILAERESYRARPIASITKLVSAAVVQEEMIPSMRIAIARSMLVAGGNSANFRIGEKFSVSDLLYPLLMVSSNDAAEALAQSYGRRAFIMKMNDWANDAGAYHTYFADPSGLSPLNISSARDVAHILATVAKDHPELLDVTLMKTKSTRIHTWVNPTHFLNLTTYLGGKNGYTDEAGRTGVGLFSVGANDRKLIIVVLGSKDRDRDMLELLHYYQ